MIQNKEGTQGLKGTVGTTPSFIGKALLVVMIVQVMTFDQIAVSRHRKMKVKIRENARRSWTGRRGTFPHLSFLSIAHAELVQISHSDFGRTDSSVAIQIASMPYGRIEELRPWKHARYIRSHLAAIETTLRTDSQRNPQMQNRILYDTL